MLSARVQRSQRGILAATAPTSCTALHLPLVLQSRPFQRPPPSRVLRVGVLHPRNSSSSLKPVPPSIDRPTALLSNARIIGAATMSSSQIREHSGHSHSDGHGHGHSHGFGGHHHHNHDNSYLISKNKNDAGVRITRLGLFVNLGMALSKGVGGYYFNSQALVADAFHALTDLVSDFMTLATISVALKPPTLQYPNGYGKVESLGSLVVSGLLLSGGLLMCQHAGVALFHQFFADAAHHAHHVHDAAEAAAHSHGFLVHSHSHSAADMIPNINAAWLAGGSIIVKEYLYRATMKIAKERKSSVLASNAVHHRVDSLTSIVALVAIGGSHLIEGATWLDPVGGLLVSLMVIQAGLGNTMAAVYELCDSTVDEEVKTSVRRAASKALASTETEIRSVQGVKAGQNYLMDIEVAMPGSWDLSQMQRVEESVRDRVGNTVRGVKRVRVRYVAKEEKQQDFADEFIRPDISPRASPEPESEQTAAAHEHKGEHAHSSGTESHSGKTKKRS